MRVSASRLRAGLALALGLLAAGVGSRLEAAPASKYSAIVVDASTGQALYVRQADTRRFPASLTKIMTLYMVFEALENRRLTLGEQITASAGAAEQPPTKLGLAKGERLTVEEAILALVTASANDVAVAVAEHLGGSEAEFARLMTSTARRLGMSRTQFRNASGLPDDSQYTTARDMAALARAMLREFPQYFGYFSRDSFRYKGQTFDNHNRLLGQFAGTDGIKTGYIRASGFNLVASVVRDGQRLVGVVFGGQSSLSRDNRMRELIEQGFERLATYVNVPPLPPSKPVARATVTASVRSDAAEAASGGWKVQVGAFESYDTAAALARRAARAVTGLLRDPYIAVEPVGGDGVRFYRAQLTPFDAARAEQACRMLRQRRIDCFTIPPEAGQLASGQSEG
jgi:D-alanyl-D-alanine carboxypeptidase